MKLTAKRKGKIIGFVTYEQIGKPKWRLFELTKIEVNIKYRKQGIATSLFKRMLKRINYRKLYLNTQVKNDNAHRFYKSMGLEVEGKLYSHYKKGVDEFVFSMFRK